MKRLQLLRQTTEGDQIRLLRQLERLGSDEKKWSKGRPSDESHRLLHSPTLKTTQSPEGHRQRDSIQIKVRDGPMGTSRSIQRNLEDIQVTIECTRQIQEGIQTKPGGIRACLRVARGSVLFADTMAIARNPRPITVLTTTTTETSPTIQIVRCTRLEVEVSARLRLSTTNWEDKKFRRRTEATEPLATRSKFFQ